MTFQDIDIDAIFAELNKASDEDLQEPPYDAPAPLLIDDPNSVEELAAIVAVPAEPEHVPPWAERLVEAQAGTAASLTTIIDILETIAGLLSNELSSRASMVDTSATPPAPRAGRGRRPRSPEAVLQ